MKQNEFKMDLGQFLIFVYWLIDIYYLGNKNRSPNTPWCIAEIPFDWLAAEKFF